MVGRIPGNNGVQLRRGEAGEPPPQETHPGAYDLALERLCRRYGLGNGRVGPLMFWVGAGLLATGVWLLIGAGIQAARQKKPKPL